MYMQDADKLPQACLLQRTRKSGVFATSSSECKYDDSKIALSMTLGDCLLFADDAIHRSMAFNKTRLTQRFALFARFFRSDAAPAKSNHSPLVLPHAACSVGGTSGPLRSHSQTNVDLLSSCYPQVYPKVDQNVNEFYNASFDPLLQFMPLLKMHGLGVFSGFLI